MFSYVPIFFQRTLFFFHVHTCYLQNFTQNKLLVPAEPDEDHFQDLHYTDIGEVYYDNELGEVVVEEELSEGTSELFL